MTSDLSAFVLAAVVWIVVIGASVLVLRAVMSEQLDEEHDESDDDVSGHVPSE